MSIDKTNITNCIQTTIDNANDTCETTDLFLMANSVDDTTENRKDFVATGNDLPDLYYSNTPEGTIYYVQELGVPLVASDYCWLGLDGREYRNDLPEFQLYAAGCNTSGSYGSNETSSSRVFSPIREATSSVDWKCIGHSIKHFCDGPTPIATKYDGTLWSWGCNYYGKLGDGTSIDRSSPVQEISSSDNWDYVSKKGGAAIKTDGTLWSWGTNGNGELGDGTTVRRSSPVQEITSSTDWCQVSTSTTRKTYSDTGGSVSSGSGLASGIKANGTLWAWGRNDDGQIGDGTTICRSSPVQEMTSSTDWCMVSAGSSMIAGLKTNGNIWTWGNNNCFRLGRTTSGSQVCPSCANTGDYCSVSAGFAAVSALKTDGTLWSWGRNFVGELAAGFSTCCSISPIQEVTSSTNWAEVITFDDGMVARKTDGSIWTAGCGTNSVVSRTGEPACCYTSPTCQANLNCGGPYGCISTDGSTIHMIKIVN